MPVAKVGTLQFTRVDIAPNVPEENVEEITRQGVDGVAYRKIGKRSETLTVRAVKDVTSATQRTTLLNTAAKMRGTLVSIYDEYSTEWKNMLVQRAHEGESHPIRSAVGGINGVNATIIVTVLFEVVDTRRNTDE